MCEEDEEGEMNVSKVKCMLVEVSRVGVLLGNGFDGRYRMSD